MLARRLVMTVFIGIMLLLILLWGIGWFSAFFLIAYCVSFICFLSSLQCKYFQCLVSDSGFIEIEQPKPFEGNISGRSFYNAWIVFLCVEEHNPLLINEHAQHNKLSRWFIVFNDSINEQDYRLIARLIVNARG